MHRELRAEYRVLVGESEEEILVGKPTYRLEGSIE
jgi:hypothetical protein